MTTRTNTTKTTKTTKAAYTATPEDIELAKDCGAFLNAGETNKLKASENAKLLHKHGAVIGKYKECPLANNFIEGRFPGGKNAKGTKVSAAVIKVILSAFRTAVKTGKGYDENASRTRARANNNNSKASGSNEKIRVAFTGKVESKSAIQKLAPVFEKMKPEDNTATLAAFVIRDGKDADEVAKTLRGIFNTMKQSDALVNLAACLIDALDDMGDE